MRKLTNDERLGKMILDLREGTSGAPTTLLDKEVIKGAERTYRRGYMHGVWDVIRALKDGATVEQIGEWVNGSVAHWRDVRPLTRAIMPPIRPKKGKVQR